MTRAARLYVVLTALFLVCLFMAEVTGGKLFAVDVPDFSFLGLFEVTTFTMTLGVIPFPVTFVITDLMNEYFGRKGVRFASLLGMGCLLLAYGLILIDLRIKAAPLSAVKDAEFEQVFASSGAIIIASLSAYLIGQIIDIHVFHFLRNRTRNRHIWLRATGSTVVSQLVDSFVVIYLAFGTALASEPWPLRQVGEVATTNFLYKLLVAIAITPLIYAAHALIDRLLGREALVLQERAARDQAFVVTPWPG
jgi:uncharacterized integral membrane protein (TIGR00697 family)